MGCEEFYFSPFSVSEKIVGSKYDGGGESSFNS